MSEIVVPGGFVILRDTTPDGFEEPNKDTGFDASGRYSKIRGSVYFPGIYSPSAFIIRRISCCADFGVGLDHRFS